LLNFTSRLNWIILRNRSGRSKVILGARLFNKMKFFKLIRKGGATNVISNYSNTHLVTRFHLTVSDFERLYSIKSLQIDFSEGFCEFKWIRVEHTDYSQKLLDNPKNMFF